MSQTQNRAWSATTGGTSAPGPDPIGAPGELDSDLARAVRSTTALRTGFYVVVLLIALGGQVSGAMEALNMQWYVALPAVGALELGGMVVLANADVRRRLGEHATLSRLLSAAIAGGAVAFNWLAHANHLEGGFYGGMSLLGYLVWLMNTENKRRDRLRAKRQLPPTPPAYEFASHWLRHPWLTRRARSLAKADPRLGLYDSLDAARGQIRAERRQAALSKVLHRKIRQALDGDTADIAVAVYDLDEIARRLAERADYDGLTSLIAADLAPARVLAGNPPAGAGGWRRRRRKNPDPEILASAERLLTAVEPISDSEETVRTERIETTPNEPEEAPTAQFATATNDPEQEQDGITAENATTVNDATEANGPTAGGGATAGDANAVNGTTTVNGAAPELAEGAGEGEPDRPVPSEVAGSPVTTGVDSPRPGWAAVTAEIGALLPAQAQRRGARPAQDRTAPARTSSPSGARTAPAAVPPAPARPVGAATVAARPTIPAQRRPTGTASVPVPASAAGPEATRTVDGDAPEELPLRDRPLPDLVHTAASRTISTAAVPAPIPAVRVDEVARNAAGRTVGQPVSLRSRVFELLDRAADEEQDTAALIDLVTDELELTGTDLTNARRYVRNWQTEVTTGRRESVARR